MTRNASIAAAIRYAVWAAAAATVPALPAHAQEVSIQEVIVTGSRIPQPNLDSIGPVTTVGAEQVKIEGVTRVEDLINNLPQAFADFGGNLSNGATGAATVNLRNLGSPRTLVLINNRRLMPGDPTQNGAASPDLNQIPGALIERVEVLTGGASAVYGADAVAGVVNFIMNDNFEGVRVDAQYSLYQHNNDSPVADLVRARGFNLPDDNVTDGNVKDITFVAGINTADGRGNATVYVGYRSLDALSQDQRDFSACGLGSSAAGGTSSALVCQGSFTTAPAAFVDDNGDLFTLGAGGGLRPFDTARDTYNFAPTNFYQRPDERKTAGVFAHYDFSERASVYTEFMFMDDRTIAQIAPSGAFLSAGPAQPPFFGRYAINCNNPFLSLDMVTQFCGGNAAAPDALIGIGRRNVEGGGRADDLRHTSFRGVIGMRGEFGAGWSYDVYGQHGTTILSENYQNDMSRSRLAKALNVVNGPGGTPVCRVNADADLSNDDPACVPYNIFQPNGVTPEALEYLHIPGLSEGSTTEEIVSGSIAADLGQYGVTLPTASEGLGVAFGAEYRSEESELRPDENFRTNDLAGQGAPTLDTLGAFDVSELFLEARLPLIQDHAFAQRLSVEAGYRYSDYSLGFDTDTYKYGLDWAPVEDVRLRGSYQRAVRSPNVQELFLQPRVQLAGTEDPCASDTPARSFADCARTGVTAAQYGNILANPAEQYNGRIGGNAELQPEVSDTYSFGIVLTPTFLSGFSLTVDYFDIKVEGLIDDLGYGFVLDQCLDTGDRQFCDLVHRAPNGSLWLSSEGFVDSPTVNAGSLRTKGIDTEANYQFDVGAAGSLALSLVGTYVDEFVTDRLGENFDCVGFYGNICGTPIPQWRHKLRATWTSPWGVDLTLTWRYIESVDLQSLSSDDTLSAPVRLSDAHLGSRTYFDLSSAYTFSDFSVFSNVTARLGISNVTDQDPPVVGAASCVAVLCNGNTFPQVYDTLGRYIFLGVTADF